MRFLFQSVVVLLIVVFFSACSNEFQITEKATEIPVVYGILSAQDTATYIRVERAFIDESLPAATLAKNPDSLYFDNISVSLINTANNTTSTLKRVDGNTEGYMRAQGTFADAPNYLYKIKRSELTLDKKVVYKLLVSKNDGKVLTESSTKVLSALDDSNNDVNLPLISAPLSFSYNGDFKVSWYPDADAVIHDVIMTFNYDETKDGATEEKSVQWKLATNYTIQTGSAGSYILSIKGRNFYQFLAGALEPNSATNQVSRIFKDASLKIISGGKPIKDYISIGLANIGITSSGEIPVYTNLSNDARGIFSSKTEYLRTGMILNKVTLDSLAGGIYTKNLNFK